MKKRNGEIDFLKFVFAIIIAGYHASIFYNSESYTLWPTGYIGVEFYFIVAGFLLAKESQNYNGEDIFDLNIKRIIKRFKNLFPYIFIACLTSILIYSFIYKWEIKTLFLTTIDSSVEIFGLQMTGIAGYVATGVTWYLSALYLMEFILYPLLCKKYELFAKYFAPLIVIMLSGYLCVSTNTISNPGEWMGFAYKGLLRSMIGISAGVVAYELKNWINCLDSKKEYEFIFGMMELGGFIMTVFYAIFYKTSDYHDFYIIPLLGLSVAISFSKMSHFKRYFKNPFYNLLGKFSLSIYLNHFYLIQILPIMLKTENRDILMQGYIIGILILSLMNYNVGNQVLKSINNYVKKE